MSFNQAQGYAATGGITYSENPRGRSLAIVTGVFMALITMLIVGRTWGIWLERRKPYADDYFAWVAYICTIAQSACTIWGIAYGLGGHEGDLNSKQQVVQSKFVFSSYFTWTFGTCFAKLAVLALCNRVFTARKYRIASYSLMGACVCFVIIFFPVFMTNCTPPQAAWDPSKGHCRAFTKGEYASVCINMVLDLCVVSFPMWPLWGLQMRLVKKISVMVLFSIGLGVVGIMVWRLYDTWYYTSGGGTDSMNQDFLTVLQSNLELWLGFIASTLPTLKPLVLFHRIPYVHNLGRKMFTSFKQHPELPATTNKQAEFERMEFHNWNHSSDRSMDSERTWT